MLHLSEKCCTGGVLLTMSLLHFLLQNSDVTYPAQGFMKFFSYMVKYKSPTFVSSRKAAGINLLISVYGYTFMWQLHSKRAVQSWTTFTKM